MNSTLGSGRRAAATALGATLVSFLLAWSWIGTMHSPSPRGVRVAVVSPQSVLTQLRAGLDARAPGAFDLAGYGSAGAAVTAVKDGDVAGAVLMSRTATGPSVEVLTAGAGGGASASLLTGAFESVAAEQHASFTTADVVPLPASDRVGASGFFLVLAALFPSVVAGSVVGLTGRGLSGIRALLTIAGFAVLLAAADTLLAVVGLGVFAGHAAAVGAILGLLSFSLALVIAAAARRFGAATLAVIVLSVLGLGVPASGGPAGLSHFVPVFFRLLAPALPNSAAVVGLRDAVYFGGHGLAAPLIGFGCWIGVGLLLLVLPSRRRTQAQEPVTTRSQTETGAEDEAVTERTAPLPAGA